MTLGSALKISYENVRQHPIWDRPLPPHVRWVDLWARYDWAPHGPANEELAKLIMGENDDYYSVRVVNKDNPLRDHHEYWGNHEEVVSRLVYEIAGRPSLDSDDSENPPASETQRKLVAGICENIGLIEKHRRRVGFINFSAILAVIAGAILVALSSTVQDWIIDLGAGFLNWLPESKKWADPIPWITDQLGGTAADFVFGLLAVFIVVYAAWRLFNLWFGAIFQKDPWERNAISRSKRP
jgi:hypothetical protein